MQKRTGRKIVLGIVLGLVCLLWVEGRSTNAGTLAQNAPPAPPATGAAQIPKNPFLVALEKQIEGREQKPAEEVFKNIQLFKGMPAGRLLKVMEVAFNRSLGVDCTHCHVPDQWEKDDKEDKAMARKMWVFMFKTNEALKQDIGKGAVNCTTCHRGQLKPALNLAGPK